MGQEMIKKGLAVAVILLFIGLAFAIPINANVSKSSLEANLVIDIKEEDTATPIELVFQLMAKLRNNKDLQELVADNDVEVDIQKEISSIVKRDEELNNLIEEIKGSDCGCDEDSSELEWFFPVICTLLLPFFTITFFLGLLGLPVGELMWFIGFELNCYWV